MSVKESIWIPDRPIAFNRDFVNFGIGITGALFLSQCIYWSKRTADNNGWFYKTSLEWEDETGLSRFEQETARKKLKALGLIEEKRAGVPAKLYYKIIVKKIVEMLKTSMRERSKPVCGNVANKSAEISQTLYKDTEITTENINAELENSTTKKSFSSSSNKSSTSKNNKNSYSSNFEIIWNRYDKKSSNKKRSQNIYARRWKDTPLEFILQAIEKYKSSIDLTYLKDFDGFLNGLIDSYIPAKVWLISKDGKRHTGYFKDNENLFISDDGSKHKLDSQSIEKAISEKRFGYIKGKNEENI